MALDRTWYDTLANDDGSNTVGSPWDKEDVDALMDATDAEIVRLDAAISAGGVAIEETTTLTGTQHNFDLDGRFTYLRCNNATALTLTGFTVLTAAPQAGDRVIVDNVGTSTVKVAHQDAGSTAANRVISPSTTGQILGANGRMELAYDTTTDRWRVALVDPGKPIAVTFSAGDYTADGSMTWTVASGDVVTDAYQQRGKVVTRWVFVQTTTVGGTLNTALRQAIPGGFLPSFRVLQPARVVDNGTAGLGFWQVRTGQTYIEWALNTGTWAASTDQSTVGGVVSFEID